MTVHPAQDGTVTQPAPDGGEIHSLERWASRIPFFSRLDIHLQETILGMGISLAWRVAGAGFSFLFTIVISRMLGASQAGIYFLALSIATVVSVIGRLGLDNAMLRYAASSGADKNWAHIRDIARIGLASAAAASLVVTAALIATAGWAATTLFAEPALVTSLQLIALSIVPLNLLTLYGELLRALKHIGKSVFVQAVGISFLSLILLWFVGDKYGSEGASAVYVIASIAIAAIAALMWRRAVPDAPAGHASFDAGLLFRMAAPLFWVSVLQIVMNMGGSIALGIWADSASVAVFNTAFRTAALVSFILFAANSIMAPKFAALYAQGSILVLGRLARSSAALTSLIALPAIILMVAWPRWIMGLYGADFEIGALALTLLALSQFVNVATGSVGFLLMMTGHEREMRNKTLVWTILYIVLLAVLVPWMKLLGAAIATGLVTIGDNVTGVWLVYTKVSILTLPLFEKAPVDAR